MSFPQRKVNVRPIGNLFHDKKGNMAFFRMLTLDADNW